MPSSAEDFDKLLLNSLEKTLRFVFGKGAAFIVESLEKHSGVGTRELCRNPELLSSGLQKIMGRAARNMERLVLQDLSSKLSVDALYSETESFADVVSTLRARALQKEKQG